MASEKNYRRNCFNCEYHVPPEETGWNADGCKKYELLMPITGEFEDLNCFAEKKKKDGGNR
jgi:hypothetical protein